MGFSIVMYDLLLHTGQQENVIDHKEEDIAHNVGMLATHATSMRYATSE